MRLNRTGDRLRVIIDTNGLLAALFRTSFGTANVHQSWQRR